MNGMRVGDYVAVFGSVSTIRAIGVVTGEYAYKGDRYDEYHHVRPVAWLDNREHDVVELNDNKKLTLQTIYELQSRSAARVRGTLPAAIEEFRMSLKA